MEEQFVLDFSGLKIRLASPEDILKWSKGEVTKPETINYRTFRAEKDGLFDERIFGPTKDFECYCGKYKRIRYKGIICDRCGVEVTTSAVRRERMGHIKLATPISHIWYFKGASTPLSIVLDVPPQALEKIIYYALYLVTALDKELQKKTVQEIDGMAKEEIKKLDEEYEIKKQDLKKSFAQQKEAATKKITNSEQKELATQEIDLREREKFRLLSDKYIEDKSKRTAFLDRIIKTVKALKVNDTLEEEDYLFLREKDIEAFVTVGMGSEVVYDLLSTTDFKKKYEEAVEELEKAKGERRNKLLKKVRILESFIKGNVQPAWMVLTVLPVIPPDLRPVVQLPGGKFATSDLNDFYRRVINRNNRLKQLIDLGAPEIILRNEKRMLQEAVDSLLDLQKSRGRARTQGVASKVQKSLSDILRGKQGRFRQNLLGKRVDYSGRSTIAVGPELKINQCGIPREMALELFKPHMLHEIIVRGLAPNIKSAKNFLELREPVVYDILEEITKDHPVLLNRAPTLHKLSVLGFYPVLTDSYVIKLHPAVCAGYNADFDGDAMGVFVPLSTAAINEVKSRMMAHQNLLKPSDGTPIALPIKEMALGIYYLTTLDAHATQPDEELRIFSSENEAISAYHIGVATLRQPVLVSIEGKVLRTSVGRIFVNQRLPNELRYINSDIRAVDIKDLVVKAMKIFNDNENNDFKKDINQDIKKEDFKQDIKQDLKQDIKKDPKQDLKNEKICNDSLDLENSIGIIGNIIENNNNFLEYSSDPSFNELKQNMRAFLVDLITKEFSSMKDRVLKKAIEKSEEEILKYFSKKQSQENKLLVVHTGVKCSQCGQNPIRGVRYKCNVCEDLNYCEKCEDEYGDKHQHPFLKIKVSEVDPLAKFNIAKDNNNDNQANKTINDNNLQTTVKVDKVDKKGKIAEVKDVDVNFDMRESTNLTQSFIFKNEDKFQAECISTNLKLNSKINSELRINLKLRNSGSISWPKNCILTCIKEKSDLIGVNIPLKLKVEPLKDNNIEIKLQTDDQEGNKKSVWRLKYDNFFFGDEFVFEIKVGESTKVNVEENKEDKANITIGTEPEKSKLDIDNHKDINDINHINDQNDPNKTEYSDINYINSYLDIENKGNIIINYKNIDLKDNKPDDVKEKVCEEKQKEKIKEVRDLYGLDNQNFTDDKIRTSLIASNWDMGDKFLDGLLENK